MSVVSDDSASPSRLFVGLLVFALVLVAWRITSVDPSVQRTIKAGIQDLRFIVAHAGQGRLE